MIGNENIILMKGISKTFSGIKALNDVEFSIKRGEVHCLAGENGSGKSTLIKILSGVLQPDSGSYIEIKGKHYKKLSAIDSINEGIEVIYQDLSLFPNLTVEENISFSERIERKGKLINWREVRNIAMEKMEKVGIELNPSTLLKDFPLAKQQLIAICRAMTNKLSLIIMDEPTSSLTKNEIESLFFVVDNLKHKGISTLFVSHKLDEVFEISDRATVLRDGRLVGVFNMKELDNKKLTSLMTGREVADTPYVRKNETERILLEVRNLSKKGSFNNINFKLYVGEILGLTGLLGSGRTEIALSIFGLIKADSGDILIDGKLVHIKSTNDAIKNGVAYVPENRLLQGLFLPKSISDNIVVSAIKKLINKLSIISRRRIKNINQYWIQTLCINTPSVEMQVKSLSGGNQQRVVLAKWLATNPKILILDGPTIGIDIGAKRNIHEIIRNLADQGIGIILISDEISEIIQNSNRALLMKNGEIIKEFDARKATENEIIDILNREIEG
ncbi:MAG: sugar ABC transporter ATP-binding protein [Actinobacteria bacterium]|nr:sugar ABC transporter ATP-binding protein [Actinomycetota bacterium]